MYSIETTIEIAAPLSTVLAAVTTTEGLRGWWTKDTQTSTAKREHTFRFAKAGGGMAVTFRVDREDDRGIAMTCVAEENNSDWLGTKLEISLAPTASGTRVQLVHAGYPAKNEVYAMCTKGWAFFLGSLQKYAQTGTGEPHGKPAAA